MCNQKLPDRTTTSTSPRSSLFVGGSLPFHTYLAQGNLAIKYAFENLQTIILEFDEIQTDAKTKIAT